MDLGLTDKVVLVTAASKGLGKAAAMELPELIAVRQVTGVNTHHM